MTHSCTGFKLKYKYDQNRLHIDTTGVYTNVAKNPQNWKDKAINITDNFNENILVWNMLNGPTADKDIKKKIKSFVMYYSNPKGKYNHTIYCAIC